MKLHANVDKMQSNRLNTVKHFNMKDSSGDLTCKLWSPEAAQCKASEELKCGLGGAEDPPLEWALRKFWHCGLAAGLEACVKEWIKRVLGKTYIYTSRILPPQGKFPHLQLDHESGWNILVFGRGPKTFDRKWSRMCFHSFLLFATSLDLPEPSYILFTEIMYLLLYGVKYKKIKKKIKTKLKMSSFLTI